MRRVTHIDSPRADRLGAVARSGDGRTSGPRSKDAPIDVKGVGRKEGVELPGYVALEAATAVLDVAPNTALLPCYSAPASDLEFVACTSRREHLIGYEILKRSSSSSLKRALVAGAK
jgi:hypothetical protein